MQRSDFYVYVIFRPNGVPCYVGKGRGKRIDRHFRSAQNPHLASIIAQAGGQLPAVKIRQNLTDKVAKEIEVAFIAAIGREANGGPLVNLTDGGDGTAGYDLPKTPAHRMAIARSNTGKVFSAERRQNISKSRIGHKLTAEQIEARRLRQTGKKRGKYAEGTGAKIAAALKGKSWGGHSDEAKARIAAAKREYWRRRKEAS